MSNHSAVTLGLLIAVVVLAALIWRLNGQISDLEGGNQASSGALPFISGDSYIDNMIAKAEAQGVQMQLNRLEGQLRQPPYYGP